MLTDSATNEQPLSLERVEAAFRRADIVVDRHGRLLAQRERHGNPAPAVSVIILDADLDPVTAQLERDRSRPA